MRLLLRFSGLVIGFCATCEGHLNALPSLNAHRHLRGSISWQAVEPGDTIRPGAARESTGSEPRLIGSNGGVSIHRGLEETDDTILAPSPIPVLDINATICPEEAEISQGPDGSITCEVIEKNLVEEVPLQFIVVALTFIITFYYMNKSYNFEIEAYLERLDSALGQMLIILLVLVDLTMLVFLMLDPKIEQQMPEFYLIFGLFATAVYLAELIIRIFASKRLFTISLFFKNPGNVIDTLVVFLDVFFAFADLASKVGMKLKILIELEKNAGFVKTLKLARMARLKRLVVAAQKASHVDIMEACETGNLGMLKRALLLGQSPHTRNPLKETPIHVAARGGHGKLLEVLLTTAAFEQQHIEARDYVGRTPLFDACYFRHREAVQKLLMHIHDVPSALAAAPWSGPQRGVTPEVLMKKRNLYDIIEAAEKKKAAIKADKDAEQAKWDKEVQTLVKMEIHRLRNIQTNLKKDLTLILNAEDTALKKAWAKWLEVIDLLDFGHYDELSKLNIEDLEKFELKKHLIAREVDMHGHESAGHRKLMKMLQASLQEEKEEREKLEKRKGVPSSKNVDNDGALDPISALAKAEEQIAKQKQRAAERAAEEKRIAEQKEKRTLEAARRREVYLRRYHWKSYEEYAEEMAKRKDKTGVEDGPTENEDDFDDDFGDFDDNSEAFESDDSDDDDGGLQSAKYVDHDSSVELQVELAPSLDLSNELS